MEQNSSDCSEMCPSEGFQGMRAIVGSSSSSRIKRWNLPLLKEKERNLIKNSSTRSSGISNRYTTCAEGHQENCECYEKKIVRKCSEKSEDEPSSSESYTSIESVKKAFDSSEIKYLKRTVGKPLRKSIAEIILKRPHDPVGYLSSCLLNYRYNEENNYVRKMQIARLIIERKRIQAEQFRKECEVVSNKIIEDIVDHKENRDTLLDSFEYVGAFQDQDQ